MHHNASFCITFSIFRSVPNEPRAIASGWKTSGARMHVERPPCTKMHQNAPLFRFFRVVSDRLTGFFSCSTPLAMIG